MKPWKKIAIFSVCVATGIIVVMTIHSVHSANTTTFRLKPGFRKESRIIAVHPTANQRASLPCYRYRNGTDTVEPFSNDAFGNKESELTLILEKDFVNPITITVKATDLEPDKATDLNPSGERDADPAIKITSSDGKFSTCYDYAEGHGSEEVLHTSNRNVNYRFDPKAGTYHIDLWSYYQPAKQYEVTISEDN